MHRRLPALLALAFGALLVLAGCASPARDDRSTPLVSSFPVTDTVTLEERTIVLEGDRVAVDVHRPAVRAGERVAVVAHGFTRTRKRHRDLGEALAAAGITAVVPDLPSIANHWTNGHAIAALVNALEQGTLGLPPVPRSHVVLIGTSAGGFASLIAGAELPGIAGWIGLDPVDPTSGASDAPSRLATVAVVLRGIPSQCNLYGSAHAIAMAVPRLMREFNLDRATHCDFESPTNRTCSIACGGASPEAARQVIDITVTEARRLLGWTGGHAAN